MLGEYERTATTVVNAYLTPKVDGYLARSRTRAARAPASRASCMVMQSAGGVAPAEEARAPGGVRCSRRVRPAA